MDRESVVQHALEEAYQDAAEELPEEPTQRKRPNDEIEPPRRRKKRRVTPEVNVNTAVQAEEILDEEKINIRNMLRKELKQLLLDHPGLDCTAIQELDTQIADLTIEQLHVTIENLRIQIGLLQPFENAKSMVGVCSILIGKYTGYDKHMEEMIQDKELLSALDHFIPNSLYWLSPPLKITYRILYHIARGFQEKK